jgi:hypothetical protein
MDIDMTSRISVNMTYQLMSKWLLANPNDPLAIGVRAEKVNSMTKLHEQEKYQSSPLGRYSATISVAGVEGQLLKCELGQVHTYLVFRSPLYIDDVVIDTSSRQFHILPEWFTNPKVVEETVAWALKHGTLDHISHWVVGTDAEIAAEFSLDELYNNMEYFLDDAGVIDDPSRPVQATPVWARNARPWASPSILAHYHHLRNDVMYTLNSSTERMNRCGAPTQNHKYNTLLDVATS